MPLERPADAGAASLGTYPFNLFPYVVGGWLLVGAILAVVVPASPRP